MRPARVLQILGAVAVCLAAVGGVLVAGGYNVAASAGHWPLVGPALHRVMKNSVAMRSEPVPADHSRTPASVRLGAIHYSDACERCHGSPAASADPVALAMVPPPPPLPEAIEGWRPGELLWIVRHGVKMSGMPAWAAPERGDEVVPVVDFLLEAASMTAEDYRRAIRGAASRAARAEDIAASDDPVSGDELERCARCHGFDGRGLGAGLLPHIGGQSEAYLQATLEAYAEGSRPSGMMRLQAARLTTEQIRALARHYAAAGEFVDRSDTSGSRESGGELARRGAPRRGVPPCDACHGSDDYLPLPRYPRLTGQRADYLATQLELFRDGRRGTGSYARLMSRLARHLDDGDIAALAAYYAGVEASGETAAR